MMMMILVTIHWMLVTCQALFKILRTGLYTVKLERQIINIISSK